MKVLEIDTKDSELWQNQYQLAGSSPLFGSGQTGFTIKQGEGEVSVEAEYPSSFGKFLCQMNISDAI